VGRYLAAWFPMILIAVANGAGRLWALVPVWVAAAPYFFFRLWRTS
jgi:hypothetical protein